MKHVLAVRHRRLLSRLAGQRTLLAFDFDGTLAPIVEYPGAAALRVSTRALLRQTARRYPCVVVSGRAAEDVQSRLEGTGLAGVIGNHGVAASASGDVEAWHVALQRALGAVAGVMIENKGQSIAVHYRHCDDPAGARERIVAATSALARVRVVGGKSVVNLLPEGAGAKGQAVLAAMATHRCETALFVGDDETDEDVFALKDLVSVRVGPSRTSAARYWVRDQREVDALLRELVRLRGENFDGRRAGTSIAG